MPQLSAMTFVPFLSRAIILLLTLTGGLSLAQEDRFQLSQPPQTLQPQSAPPAIQPRSLQQPQAPPQLEPRQPNLFRSPCPRAIKINTNYDFRGTLHFVCLQATRGRPQLEVIQYSNRALVMSMPINEPNVNQLASFVDETGALRILLAVSNRLNGTSMYSIDKDGQFINEAHTISTQYVNSLSIWKMELNMVWQLAVANQPTYQLDISGSSVPDTRPMIALFYWRRTYFDRYDLIYLPEEGRINKLEPMNINGQEFLIVAVESPRVMDTNYLATGLQPYGADSLIYRLEFGSGELKWNQFQNLTTQVAHDCKSFAIDHRGSLRKDYYIAIIGQAKTDSSHHFSHLNRTSNQPNYGAGIDQPQGLLIYKYFGDKFRRTEHFVHAPGVMKLDAITYGTGNSFVIIALLSSGSNQVNLYLFDGLILKPLPGPYNRPTQSPSGSLPYLRQRRTMDDAANFHLFMAPPTPVGVDEFNGTTIAQQKRTLTDNSIQMPPLPTLALSSVDLDHYNDIDGTGEERDPTVSEVESAYHIPLDDVLEVENEEEKIQTINRIQMGSEYNKRNNIGMGEDLFGWCKKQIDQLLKDDFDAVAKRLITLPRINQKAPIHLIGDLIIERDLHVSNLIYARQIEERINPLQNAVVATPPIIDLQTFESIHQVNRDIQIIEKQVDRILVDDNTPQEIFTTLWFDELSVDCLTPAHFNFGYMHHQNMSGLACPFVNEIRTPILNSRNISDIRTNAFLTGRTINVKGDIRFEHLVLRGKVGILHSLNGIQIEDIVFKRGMPAGSIGGHKTFSRGLYSASKLTVQNWNGFIVDSHHYLTSSGAQRIEAPLQIRKIILDSGITNSRIEKMNGLHLDTQLGRIAVADGDNRFETAMHFDELILNGPVNLLGHRSNLCQVDIDDLWANAMFKGSKQNITAPMRFENVHINFGGDIIVDGLINGVVFNPSTVLRRDSNFTFKNQVIIEGNVNIRDLTLGGSSSLNGIQVVDNQLAILYNGGTQRLTGDKIFDDVHLSGDNYIERPINGQLNISELYRIASQHNEPHTFAEVNLGGQNVYKVSPGVDFHVASSVNGIPVDNLCGFANEVAQRPLQYYKRLKFDQPIRFRSLRCASINGFNNLTRSFLTRSGDQIVAGTLRLLGGAIFNTSVSVGSTLNGMYVAPLAGAIAKTVNETRSGHKDVRGDMVLEELFADRINNLNLANIFLTRSDEPQYIRAPMTFDHLDIENVLVIGRGIHTNTFNGLNVTDILSNTLQYDTPQTIYREVQLEFLQLLPNSNFQTESFNSHNLQRLYADSVLKDSYQQILAPKTFRGTVDFLDRVNLRYGINGISAEELKSNLLLHGEETIDGDVEFKGDVFIKKELEIQSGMINDMDVNLFVDSMLHEDRKSMKVLNGSVRFKDVKVNNLVVGGKIQGIDLSREALLKGDYLNGSYGARLEEQRAKMNNARLLNFQFGPGSRFPVQSHYKGANHQGICYVHSCENKKLWPTIPYPPAVQQRPPVLIEQHIYSPTPSPPQQYVMQFYPKIVPKVHFMNQQPPAWKPNYEALMKYTPPNAMQTHFSDLKNDSYYQIVLFDPYYEEYRSRFRQQAILDLATRRVNKLISVSFYYEIFQKHPLLGPVLHAASDPMKNAQGSALLLLKGTSKPGEPCLTRGQTIAVMAQQRRRAGLMNFSQSSRIQETSNPISVVSAVVESHGHYLFVLDTYPEGSLGTDTQVIIYFWNQKSGMYEFKDRLRVEGSPTSMKAFTVNKIVCLAVANPKLVTYSNNTGEPTVFCQSAPFSNFNAWSTLPMRHVFDLDVSALPGTTTQVVIGALSQQHAEQIGDLVVGVFEVAARSWTELEHRRMVRPTKLHFFSDIMRPLVIKLAVSEAITSNDHAEAFTRIFALEIRAGFGGVGRVHPNTSVFYETQILRDNQFYDIQSVHLDNMRSILFFQSANSISIYAPANAECGDHYSMVQRLPTKGANKFLVFNNHMRDDLPPFDHYLVLSKDNCEQQQYASIILKSRFT